MLQIKKNTMLIKSKYNLSFLFRKRRSNKLYLIEKQKTSTILLRSPKHFNIGKQKITNLNYKTPKVFFPVHLPLSLNTFLLKKQVLYNILSKKIKTNPTLNISSIRVQIGTKFILMWLET